MKMCPFCNSELDDDVLKCKNCGEWVNKKMLPERDFGKTQAFAFFFGIFGVHRFYTGYKKIGVIQLILTFTLLGIFISSPWAFIDTVKISLNKYKDSLGRELNNYNRVWGIAIAVISIMCYICLLTDAIIGFIRTE